MAQTQALAGKQTVVKIGTGGPPPDTWTDIVEVIDIGELPIERSVYDATFHDDSFYRNTVSGLYVISSLTMTANYVKAQYESLFTKIGEDTPSLSKDSYRLVFPDDFYHEFVASVTNITPATQLDGVLTYSLTLTIDGEITTGTLP